MGAERMHPCRHHPRMVAERMNACPRHRRM